MRTITVKGTGNVSARPDYIILSLNIEVLSETYDRAMSEAAERIERLQGAAVRVGYRKEDLKTTSFDVQTRFENVKDRQGNYKREFAGYACSYQRLKPVYDAFQKAKDKPSFKAKHEAELVIFEAARSTLLAMQGDEKLPSLKTLQAEQQRLLDEQQRLYDERAKLKKEVKQIETIKSNVDTFLAPSADHDRDHLRSTQRE